MGAQCEANANVSLGNEDWPYCADAKTDLNLCCTDMPT